MSDGAVFLVTQENTVPDLKLIDLCETKVPY